MEDTPPVSMLYPTFTFNRYKLDVSTSSIVASLHQTLNLFLFQIENSKGYNFYWLHILPCFTCISDLNTSILDANTSMLDTILNMTD